MSLIPSLLTLGAGFGLSHAVERLRDHRRPTRPTANRHGLVDLLPYFAIVHDGPPSVVLNKNGSFTSVLRFQGPDRASSTDPELNNLVRHFSQTLAPYTNSWTFHCDTVRRPAPAYPEPGAFPDPLTSFLDQQRRQAYLSQSALFETASYLTITYRPPAEMYQHVLLRFQQGVEKEGRGWNEGLAKFVNEVDTLKSRLSTVLRVTALDSGATLSHLYSCITGLDQPVLPPGPGIYLDRILSTRQLTTGWEPKIDDQVLIPVSLFHLPGSLSPAHLHTLDDLPFPFRLSIRFTLLDTRSAQSLIDKYTKGWFWGQKSLRTLVTTKSKDSTADDPFVNQHAVSMMSDASEATAINQEGQHRFAFVTAVALIPGATRAIALENARTYTKLLADLGVTSRIETYNATAAYHGSLPGETSANLRAPLVNLLPTSALLPLTSLWPGLTRHPCQFFAPESPPILVARTDGNTPFRLFLHSGDLAHTVVVGPPGAGKSTLLTALAAGHLRYEGSRVFFFDRDHSALVFAAGAGGSHYDIGGEGSISFQPLRDLDDDSLRAAALTWLETLVALQLPRVTVDHTRTLSFALDALVQLEPPLRTLQVLAEQIKDRELRSAIELFTTGPYGNILGGNTDNLDSQSRLQVFEMRALMDLDPKVHLPVLLHLLQRIERGLDGSPTLIILDEAGLALLHPMFSARIREWALTLRKRNAGIVLAFQALSQLEANSSFSTLLQSCPGRFYLPNADALSPTVRAVYEACGLNARQIELIARARRKQDYYWVNPDGARLCSLALTRPELAFFGTLPGMSLQETHTALRNCIAQHRPHWQPHWLRLAGNDPAAAAELQTLIEMEIPS